MPIEVPRDISSDLPQRLANWPAYVIDTDRGICVRTCPNMSSPNKFRSRATFLKMHPINSKIFVDKTTDLIVNTLGEIHELPDRFEFLESCPNLAVKMFGPWYSYGQSFELVHQVPSRHDSERSLLPVLVQRLKSLESSEVYRQLKIYESPCFR